jgi:hypothetical protein
MDGKPILRKDFINDIQKSNDIPDYDNYWLDCDDEKDLLRMSV